MISFSDKSKKIIKIIKGSWNDYPFFASIFIFGLFFLAYASVYLNNQGISAVDDHLFQFKYAYLIRTIGWDAVANFDWINFSKIAQEHIRYGITLFQMSIIPFTFFKDPIFGLKMFDIFNASLSFGLLFYVFRKLKVEAPFVFLLILSSSGYFLTRSLSGRAFVFVVALVFLEIYLAVEKKYDKIFWVFLLHVLWHQATFFFPLVVIAVVEAARYMASHKIFWKNFLSAGLASFFGMAFFPNFPHNIVDFIKVILGIHSGVFKEGSAFVEGNEVYTRNALSNFLGNAEIYFLIFFVCTVVVIYYYVSSKKDEKISNDSLSISMYATFFFCLVSIAGSLMISGRFYDFYFPAVVFLGAIIFTKLIRDGKVSFNKSVSRYLFFGVLIFYVFSIGNTFLTMNLEIAKIDYRHFKEASQWVRDKSDGKGLIFMRNWSYFAVSFFYNSDNKYTMGLEPIALMEYSPELYWKWHNIFASNYYCEETRDCSADAIALVKEISEYSDEQKEKIYKLNGEKILNSIKNDFKSNLIMSDSHLFNSSIDLNKELIEESFEFKSEINNSSIKVYKLK